MTIIIRSNAANIEPDMTWFERLQGFLFSREGIVDSYSHLQGNWLWTVGVSCIKYTAGDNDINLTPHKGVFFIIPTL
jgi:hypothetical protein